MYKPPHYGWTRWEHIQYKTLCYLWDAFCSLRHQFERGGKAVGEWCFQQALKARRGSDALLDRRNYRQPHNDYYWPGKGPEPPQHLWQLAKVMFPPQQNLCSTCNHVRDSKGRCHHCDSASRSIQGMDPIPEMQELKAQFPDTPIVGSPLFLHSGLVNGEGPPAFPPQPVRAAEAKNPLFNWLRFMRRKKDRGPADVDWKAVADVDWKAVADAPPGYSVHKMGCPFDHGGACTCAPPASTNPLGAPVGAGDHGIE